MRRTRIPAGGKMAAEIAKLCLIAVMAVSLSPETGHAGETDNRCVQEQLTALGFDTRGIDGQIGPATQAAFSDYLRASGRETELPLDDDTAPSWCIQVTLVAACRSVDAELGVAALGADRFIGSRKTGSYLQLVGAFVSATSDGVSAHVAQFSPYFPDRARCDVLAGYRDPDEDTFVLGDLADRDYGGWVFGPEIIQRIRAERVSMEQFRTMSDLRFSPP